jgi:hypothetical protein
MPISFARASLAESAMRAPSRVNVGMVFVLMVVCLWGVGFGLVGSSVNGLMRFAGYA